MNEHAFQIIEKPNSQSGVSFLTHKNNRLIVHERSLLHVRLLSEITRTVQKISKLVHF